ncbi:META domain-containing protein [Roseobacter denitrificans]|uniref:Conserved domain protein n=1 Tax=Roseobacter denitrificans (strain ATCC 33942 / OCh 114) TaxID=375451 RepID=Q16AI2_ROSDO|nr:META domain-containing protein [Roseobacter denitrificans]ABG31011.1 conserved domain protein [Roseobacter denitrificans OCh 114]AVL54090.1 META domain-containing protein [Roseobacter denitrificans]SFG12584.1 heat shock protein HslJ [Roseobacter denitrificans OCh 114]
MKTSAAIAVALLAVNGCTRDETAAAYGGADKVWRVVEIDDIPFASRATLTFPAPGQIAGDAPCNSYSAAITVPYPWFDAGPIVATKKRCADASHEARFLEALANMSLSEILRDTMILSTPEGRSIIFKADG